MSSGVESDSINGEFDIWSNDKCIFCNLSLEKKTTKILKCLHIICDECLLRQETCSSLKCKCQTITNGEFLDFPITSGKICSVGACTNTPSIMCTICKKILCPQCGMNHILLHEDGCILVTFPLKSKLILCSTHPKQFVDHYCASCSLLICNICYLTDHKEHWVNDKIDEISQKLKSNYSIQSVELERNINFFNFHLSETEKQIKDLEKQRNYIKKQIDIKITVLHEEIDKRADELKVSVDKCFLDGINKTNENKQKLEDSQKENKYYKHLTESILNYGSKYDIVNLSKPVMNKLIFTNNLSNISKETLKFKIDLVFDHDDMFNKCIAAIKEFGSIKLLQHNNLSQKSNNVVQTFEMRKKKMIELGNILSKKSKSGEFNLDIEHLDDETLAKCSSCGLPDKLIQCSSCKRYYHNNCHIPSLSDEITNNDLLAKNWSCTMCEDVHKLLRENNLKSDSGFDKNKRKIIERILLELYCQTDDSEHFTNCVDKIVYPMYYERVTNPISLNDIKSRLMSDTYTSSIEVINDLKRVFSNAISYYHPTHPFHAPAVNLQKSLRTMLKKWMP